MLREALLSSERVDAMLVGRHEMFGGCAIQMDIKVAMRDTSRRPGTGLLWTAREPMTADSYHISRKREKGRHREDQQIIMTYMCILMKKSELI